MWTSCKFGNRHSATCCISLLCKISFRRRGAGVDSWMRVLAVTCTEPKNPAESRRITQKTEALRIQGALGTWDSSIVLGISWGSFRCERLLAGMLTCSGRKPTAQTRYCPENLRACSLSPHVQKKRVGIPWCRLDLSVSACDQHVTVPRGEQSASRPLCRSRRPLARLRFH